MLSTRWSGLAVVLGVLLLLAAGVRAFTGRADTKSIEDAVLAVNAEMTKAAEAGDADRLFSYMLDTDKGSIIRNGVFMVTRQEALEQIRNDLGRISKIQYRWKRQYVTVLSPDVALLTAEGEASATRPTGEAFTAPFGQTVVFVLRGGAWKAIHAHQSAAR